MFRFCEEIASGGMEAFYVKAQIRLMRDSEGALIMQRYAPKPGEWDSIVYDPKCLLSFVNAHSPLDMLKYAEEHGYLFMPKGYCLGGQYAAPSSAEIKSCYDVFHWTRTHGRKMTSECREIALFANESLGSFEERPLNPWEVLPWEPVGDWLAARLVLLKAVEIWWVAHEEGTLDEPCSSFQVSLSGANRYLEYLKPFLGNAISIRSNGNVEYTQFWVNDDTLMYTQSALTVKQVLNRLVNMHVQNGFTPCFEGGSYLAKFRHHIAILCYQASRYLFADKTHYMVGFCENQKCKTPFLKTKGSLRLSCCNACASALKGLRMHGW